MSEPTPEATYAGMPLSADQEAYLTQQAADQAAASSAATEMSAAQEAISRGQRGPVLPAEEAMDALMAQLRAQSDQLAALQAKVGTMGRQIEEAQAAQGGPLTVRYAQGALDKLAVLAVSRPDHPGNLVSVDVPGREHPVQVREHFSPVITRGRELVEAATAAAKSATQDNASAVARIAGQIERFANRTHGRLGGAPLDWSAILDDIELAADEALKLVA